MKKKIFPTVLFLLCSLTVSSNPFALAGNMLQGNVNETSVQHGPSAPAMSRTDINRGGDPFAGNVQQEQPLQAIDVPQAAFAMPSNQPAAPSKMFPLSAQDEGQQQQPNFQTMQAQPQNQPQQPMQQGNAQTSGDPNDPDANSQALQLAWDTWHHNVAQAVYQRYTNFSNMAFSHSPPMTVSVSYTVTRDCQVQNIQLTQKSPNFLFNTLILTVIKSLNGDTALLTFPQGSRRMSVEKAGTFSVNNGIEGFKYLTGDKETIRHH
ncbi:MAG TPA: hypothetical protein V6C86_04210 [Oculatellaceae cyanobacterium]